MNKNLLTAIAISFSVSLFAQDRTAIQIERPIPKGATPDMPAVQSSVKPANPIPSVKAAASWNKVYIGQSANVYGLLLSESRVLTYNEDLDLLAYTNRWNQPSATDPGHIVTWYSTDHGCNWDSVTVGNGTTALRNRYPSGVIYNPPGNTNPMDAYLVFAGPITDGNGWQGNYFGSSKLDGTNQTYQTELVTTPGVTFQHMARVSMQATDDGRVRILGQNFDWNNTATATWKGVVINTGTFDNSINGFTWTTDVLNHPIGRGTTGDQYLWSFNGGMAWAEDGDVGYAVMVGADSLNMTGIYPIVFKTIDSGATWNKMPFYDFTTVSGITDEFEPTLTTASGKLQPFFHPIHGMGLTVDHNDQLHIVTTILHGSSDHKDSLTFTWNYSVDKIFDVYTTPTGWEAFYVDSIATDQVTAANDATWGAGWDSRVQVSRSADGTVLHYGWIDTDVILSATNDWPDVYTRSRNLVTGVFTPTQNLTVGTAYDANNYWFYTADKLIPDSATTGGYIVPRATSFGAGSGSDPFNHYYFGYLDCPVGIAEAEVTGFTLSQNMPNPFNGNTRFELSSVNPGTATIVVANLMGQTVAVESIKVNSGSQLINFNASDLTSGFYNYSVTINGETISKKILIN